MVRFLVLVVLVVVLQPVGAAIDAYPFPDEELRTRYDLLIDELRCPQCLNTNLAGSDAMIAQDLRREVHRMLLEGATDEEILSFMHERYGDFILYNPRVNSSTAILWFGPVLFILLALIIIFQLTRRKETSSPLTTEEQAKVEALLKDRAGS